MRLRFIALVVTGWLGLLLNRSVCQDVPGMALSRYCGLVPITSEPNGGQYRLKQLARNIQVHDKRFGSNSHDVTNPIPDWTQRFTLTNLSISTWGTAWQDLEDPGAGNWPEIELQLCTSSGTVIRSVALAYMASGSYDLNEYNLVVHPGLSRLLIVDDDLFTDDTLAFMDLTLSTASESIGGWANGASGSLSKVTGDAAVDVYWGLMQAYDFVYDHWGWVPVGNNNIFNLNCPFGTGKVSAYVNDPGVSPLNAVTDNPCNHIRIGLGISETNGPRVALDWMAHEYAHIVSGLVAQTSTPLETRALSEAFSDMMAASIERHVFMTTGVPAPTGTQTWLFGEHTQPNGQRSISHPVVDRYDPTTGTVWSQAVATEDIYMMAGVPDRWFYLLVNGGSGVSGGIPYSVDGIGWEQAIEVAYRGIGEGLFRTSANASFHQAVASTINSAQTLFPGTNVALSVEQAWAAVGLVDLNGCPGEATWVASTGIFTDGSGSANYGNNLDCDWLIKPTGAETISVYFTQFNVSAGDTLYIHQGDDASGPVLAKYSGAAVPPLMTFNTSSITVRFLTNTSGNSTGWSLNYSANAVAYCSSATAPFTAPAGNFGDGSGTSSYASNTHCGWYIAPPGATSVTLSFTAFDTEPGLDMVRVYDGLNTTVPPIATFSGNSLPGPVIAPSGSMFVEFVTNSTVQGAGWDAAYTSTGGAFCGGTTLLNASNGSFSDGSGSSNYQNNLSCGWLLQPAGATAIQLSFDAFDVEALGTYGQVYDAVRVYDGASASAPLLGTFTGSTLPPALTSSGPALFVQFTTDNATVSAGWSANYSALTGGTCSGTTLLTNASGSFEDGSGAAEYAPGSLCSWLIQPDDAVSITLSFSAFDTQLNADGVVVYDGSTTSSPVLGFFSGNMLPPSLSSSNGSVLVRFVSDATIGGQGFQANYEAVVLPPGPPAIVGYEYWYDEDDEGATYHAVTPTTQLALEEDLFSGGIAPGGHVLHIRFKYINGMWSSVLSRSFLKSPGTTNGIPFLSAMQYWFDEESGAATTVVELDGSQVDLEAVLQTGDLPFGGHTLHMRFLGNAGWSSVLSRSYFQGPASAPEALIDGYEYWFDEEVADALSASIAPVAELNLSALLPTDLLPSGLHMLHIRFHGTGGWSSVLSRPFFRAGAGNAVPNLVAGYRYWFNDSDAEAVSVTLASPQSPHTLVLSVSTDGLVPGEHVFHIQFQDIGGNWGSVLSQGFTRTPVPAISLPVRVLLDGPYEPSTGLMLDSLRTNGQIPLSEPYTAAGFLQVGEGGGESIAPSLLASDGPNAIVDWVLIEVRSAEDNTVVVNTRSALLQRDGDVVDLDGVSVLSMAVPPGDYHVAVRHRNHLGAMTQAVQSLSTSTTLIDFTSAGLATYGVEARKTLGGLHLLWSGEVLRDGSVKYVGASNDRDPVLVRIGGTVPTNTAIGYFPEDVTLDGVVKYVGASNDRDVILVTIGGSVPTAVRVEQLP